MSNYYITTPIYYPSGKFHIGTAYTEIWYRHTKPASAVGFVIKTLLIIIVIITFCDFKINCIFIFSSYCNIQKCHGAFVSFSQ